MYPLRNENNYSPIITRENVFTDEEIEKFIELTESFRFEKGKVFGQSDIGIKSLENYFYHRTKDSYRKSQIKFIPWTRLTDWFYSRLIGCIHEVNFSNYNYVLTSLEDIQFSKYCEEENSYYKAHVDNLSPRMVGNYEPIRKLSFSVQLSEPDNYEGGDLKICNESDHKVYNYHDKVELTSTTALKTKGSITFFPSNYFHEVTPVSKGIRYSIVGWVNGPNVL